MVISIKCRYCSKLGWEFSPFMHLSSGNLVFLSFPFHLPSSLCFGHREEPRELGRGPGASGLGLKIVLGFLNWCSGLSCDPRTVVQDCPVIPELVLKIVL